MYSYIVEQPASSVSSKLIEKKKKKRCLQKSCKSSVENDFLFLSHLIVSCLLDASSPHILYCLFPVTLFSSKTTAQPSKMGITFRHHYHLILRPCSCYSQNAFYSKRIHFGITSCIELSCLFKTLLIWTSFSFLVFLSLTFLRSADQLFE